MSRANSSSPSADPAPAPGLRAILVSIYLLAVGGLLLLGFQLPVDAREKYGKALRRLTGRSPKTSSGVQAPPVTPTAPPTRPDPEPRSKPEPHAPLSIEERLCTLLPGRGECWLDLFECPVCRTALHLDETILCCVQGHEFPTVGDVPRFVPGQAYASSFGFEWNQHPRTQVDSAAGFTLSVDTLREKTGLGPEDVRGKVVLDAGTGSGRFSEVLASWGATVCGIDLSSAVEAASSNLASTANTLIAQADILAPPFEDECFDLIVSIGVLHHTPSTEAAFHRLARLLRPGGTFCLWVYPSTPSYRTRKRWIPFTSRIPTRAFYAWCQWFTALAARHEGSRWLQILDDYFFPYSQSGLGYDADVLDTFDGYSPRFHGVHGEEEVASWFREAGLEAVEALSAHPTAVRGRKPAAEL